jgi:hypothetical protein
MPALKLTKRDTTRSNGSWWIGLTREQLQRQREIEEPRMRLRGLLFYADLGQAHDKAIQKVMRHGH